MKLISTLVLICFLQLSWGQQIVAQDFGISIGTETIKRDTIQVELGYAKMEHQDDFKTMLDGVNLNMRMGRSDIHEFQLSLTQPKMAADTFVNNFILGRFSIKNIFLNNPRCKMAAMGSYFFVLRNPVNPEDWLMGVRLQAPMEFILTDHIALRTEISTTYKLFGLISSGLQNRYNAGVQFSIGEKAKLEFGAIFLHQQLKSRQNEDPAIWMNRRYISGAATFQLHESIALSFNARHSYFQSNDFQLTEFGDYYSAGVAFKIQKKAKPAVQLDVKETDVY